RCLSVFFFFSSRRRHTRFSRDWSSDVCSSDLTGSQQQVLANIAQLGSNLITINPSVPRGSGGRVQAEVRSFFTMAMAEEMERLRSEERRVGKECRCGGRGEEETEKGEERRWST